MTKACNFCGNSSFKETQTQYIYQHDKKMLIVNDVPCEQCEFCGEQYFKAEVLRKIESDFFEVYSSRRKAQSEVLVPIEQFC